MTRGLAAAIEALQSDPRIHTHARDASQAAIRLADAIQRFRVNGSGGQVVGLGTVLTESSDRSK